VKQTADVALQILLYCISGLGGQPTILILKRVAQVEIHRDRAGRLFVHNKMIQKSRFLHRSSSGGCDDWMVVRSAQGKYTIVSQSGAKDPIELEQLFKKKKQEKNPQDGCTNTI
jgi:hypothetical protein